MKPISLSVALFALTTACTTADVDDGVDPAETADTSQALGTAAPFGFAHVAADGTLGEHLGSPTSTWFSTGIYTVSFAGLGSPGSGNAGNWQITGEGASNAHCSLRSKGGSGTIVTAVVHCTTPAGIGVNAPFAIAYVRETAVGGPLAAAYATVGPTGAELATDDYNSTGTANAITHNSTGTYTVSVHGSGSSAGSYLVTPMNNDDRSCSIVFWTSLASLVQCKDHFGNLADAGFTYAFHKSSLPIGQQGATAYFNGTSVTLQTGVASNACGSVSVGGSRSGSVATITVSGDLSPYGGSAFPRATFVTPGATGGYCKVLSATATPPPGASTATIQVQCFDPTGAVIAAPQFFLTHVTGDTYTSC